MRFLTAGESHGPCLIGIVEGMPAGLPLTEERIAVELSRRQKGYGRGGRMQIEQDRAEILSGVTKGETTGAPIALRIENKDWPNWKNKDLPPLTVPRPGHADLAGKLKYSHHDLRSVSERASARETAMRVAIGAIAKALLQEFDITIFSHVLAIGDIRANIADLPYTELAALAESSALRCADPEATVQMKKHIDKTKNKGDSLGGIFEVIALGVPPGLGSYVHWDRRLDGLLAQAVMSIPAIKGVEIGEGFAVARLWGTEAHDELFYTGGRLTRRTNRAGGIEGGVSNGEPIVVRAAMKPIPTTVTPLHSVDLATGIETQTQYLRSDVCAVPAAGIVAEAMAAWILASAFLEKLGGDSLEEIRVNFAHFQQRLAEESTRP
ncbi:MAG: chorismate synthase [Chloroflexi bacterium]|nr:chorismate synthase [Chloroflexota bacterium]MCL5076293.1 chorismate synthase [Chloroflexota bacterium]